MSPTPLGLIDCVDHVSVREVFDFLTSVVNHDSAPALIKRNAIA